MGYRSEHLSRLSVLYVYIILSSVAFLVKFLFRHVVGHPISSCPSALDGVPGRGYSTASCGRAVGERELLRTALEVLHQPEGAR